MAAFARSTRNGGLIVTASPLTTLHHDLIIALASRHRLPAVYPEHLYVKAGGLLSYGPNFADEFRRAARLHLDRILKGAKPADLPVQAPTKYELAINLKTAKALGLTVAPTLLARATVSSSRWADDRFWQIVLQKSPRRGCRIEIRNNRIEANGFLNQRCASAHDLESILRARMRKIVLQHNRHIAAPDVCDGTSAVGESRHRIPGATVGQPD